jgi:hypothetical protein
MRPASGTAKKEVSAATSIEMTWMLCPMMYSGLVLPAEEGQPARGQSVS